MVFKQPFIQPLRPVIPFLNKIFFSYSQGLINSCSEKGRLIKSSDCRREKDKGIEDYLKEVAQILNNSPEANDFLGLVRQEKPRYIRDQLKIIKDHSKDKNPALIQEALIYCLRYEHLHQRITGSKRLVTELEQLKNDMKRLKITEAAAVVEEKLIDAQVKELNRLIHKSEVIHLTGDSYRIKHRQTIFGNN